MYSGVGIHFLGEVEYLMILRKWFDQIVNINDAIDTIASVHISSFC